MPLALQERETEAARTLRLSDRQAADLKAWQKNHRWSPNQLRHAKGTEVRRTLGLEAAQVTLGHRKADVTQIYAQRNDELGKEVARVTG